MINVKYQFIRRLLGISLSICTAYGAMRSAFVMASTLGTAPGTFLVAEAKTEQTAGTSAIPATVIPVEGTAAADEDVNEVVTEDVIEEGIEDVIEDTDQDVNEEVLKEEEAQILPEPATEEKEEAQLQPEPEEKEEAQLQPEPEEKEEAQLQPEPEPEEPDVTLDDFLAGLRCGACGRCCSLLNPHCRRGMHKAQSAELEYYETYALS